MTSRVMSRVTCRVRDPAIMGASGELEIFIHAFFGHLLCEAPLVQLRRFSKESDHGHKLFSFTLLLFHHGQLSSLLARNTSGCARTIKISVDHFSSAPFIHTGHYKKLMPTPT